MSGYIGTVPVPQATQTRNTYTATASQTTFAASYQPGFLDVYLNGVKLINGSDFTATDGSNVVLSVGADLNDSVAIVSFSTFEISSNATAAQGTLADSAVQPNDNPTFGTVNATTVDLGDWTITESGGSLYFATGGTNKMKLDASGNLDVVGSVNSSATIT